MSGAVRASPAAVPASTSPAFFGGPQYGAAVAPAPVPGYTPGYTPGYAQPMYAAPAPAPYAGYTYPPASYSGAPGYPPY